MNQFNNLTKISSLIALLTILSLVATTSPALASAGPPSGRLYADDRVWQTVGTPTQLPSTHGQPFNQLYRFVSALPPGGPATDQQYPLSDYAPGQKGFVGGRWHVVLVVDSGGNPISGYDFSADPITSLSEYMAKKAANGWTEISTDVYFECPLIPVR